jgi:SAM-dependent methyltransferase
MASLALSGSIENSARLKLAFVAAILLSAFLLFSVQPMFTRMVLPQLGGSPAVWSVAMVFFQTLLLAGYVYAHLSTRFLPHRAAVLAHGALLVVAFALLPISVPAAFGEPPQTGQPLWLIGLFAATVGLPFFALSATAPLLQAWFGRSGHPQAGNPYFLYAASNVGSFAALLCYPLLVEPLLPLKAQTFAWMWGFAGLMAALGLCGWMAARRPRQTQALLATAALRRVGAFDRLAWAGLAAVPSGLLVAATAHLSTDVASAPFMWVVPLAIFLLTFVLAFRERPVLSDALLAQLTRYVLSFVLISAMGMLLPLSIQILLHLGGLALVATLCHRMLYLRRPETPHLTEFYLCMSFGGMLGGLFTGLVAPLLFSTVLEYPLLLVAGALCLPQPAAARPLRVQAAIAVALLATGLGFWAAGSRVEALLGDGGFRAVTFVTAAAVLSIVILHRIGSVASAGALAAAILVFTPFVGGARELAVRSFFGVNYVKIGFEGEARTLVHGSTIHGAVRLADLAPGASARRPEPTTYYHDRGGINLALTAARRVAGGRLGDVAVLGLGAGALACQAAPGERWTYFEIDAEVAKLARRADLFPFLTACTPDARTVLGDARLTMWREPGQFDVIVLDAFSSDAVPAHLLTREAVAGYAARLRPGGVIIAHVSNRHMELISVVEAAGLANGLFTAAGFTAADTRDPGQRRQFAADTRVVMLASDRHATDAMIRGHGWSAASPGAVASLWTDDYANIMGAIWRNARH